MRRRRVLAGVLLLGLCAPAQAEDRVTFRYAPPDGLHLVLRQTDHETRFLAGHGSQQSTAVARTDFKYRRTEDGFELRTTALSFERRRDGKVLEDPVAKVLLGLTHVYRIDEDGRLVGVDGFKGLLERARADLPPEVVQAVAPMLDPALLEAAEKAEWRRRYSGFAGATVSIGDIWTGTANLTLPSGERVEHPVRTSFARASGCGGATCIEILTVSASEQAEPGAPVIRYEERRVLEPETMRVRRETLEQSIEMMLQTPGRPSATARLTLSREYVYESP